MKSSSLEKLIPQTEEDIEKLIWVDKKEMDKYLGNTYPSIKEVIEENFNK